MSEDTLFPLCEVPIAANAQAQGRAAAWLSGSRPDPEGIEEIAPPCGPSLKIVLM